MSETTTPMTRAIQMAHGRISRAYQHAVDKHAHTPMMHTRIDARTHQKRVAEHQNLMRFMQEGTLQPLLQKDTGNFRTPTGKTQKLRAPGPAIQSAKNRAAGRPEMPTSFESGSGGDWATVGDGSSDNSGSES